MVSGLVIKRESAVDDSDIRGFSPKTVGWTLKNLEQMAGVAVKNVTWRHWLVWKVNIVVREPATSGGFRVYKDEQEVGVFQCEGAKNCRHLLFHSDAGRHLTRHVSSAQLDGCEPNCLFPPPLRRSRRNGLGQLDEVEEALRCDMRPSEISACACRDITNI